MCLPSELLENQVRGAPQRRESLDSGFVASSVSVLVGPCWDQCWSEVSLIIQRSSVQADDVTMLK